MVLWMSPPPPPRFLIHPCGKKKRKKEEQNREERERRIERNSKRKTVRHSIIKRENEYGVLSAQSHDDNFQRGKRTVVSRLRVP